jgi:hypothetical protein
MRSRMLSACLQVGYEPYIIQMCTKLEYEVAAVHMCTPPRTWRISQSLQQIVLL